MKFRKSYFSALAISLVVLFVAGAVALFLALTIPSSPWAVQWKFMADNRFSPAALYSDKYQREAPAVAMFDFWTSLPIMMLAGIALGAKLASKATLRETLVYSIFTSLILAGLILGLDWYITLSAQSESLASAGYTRRAAADTHYLLLAAGNIALWTVLYSVGAVAGHIARQRLAPPRVPPKGQRSANSGVATIP
ncbi:MAG TPA: hypothetical protein VFW40_14315 [Capsulimonadaceae bacterium]|nr:hypothetical protein [Capsulimonadaceae bacterium]